MNVELNVALSGDRAIAWLQSRNRQATPLGEDLRLFADLISSPNISIMRIWHTPAEIRLQPMHETNNDHVYLSFMMNGTLSVADEEGRLDAGAPPIYLHDTAGSARVRTEEESSRFVFGIRRSRIEAVLGPDLSDGRARIPDVGLRRVALAAAEASLDAELDETAPSFPAWGNAIESLVVAALQSTVRSHGDAEPLLHRAQQLIVEHANEPGFAVSDLARLLLISHSHLHRIFRAIETTPAKALREQRLKLAHDLLPTSPTAQDLQTLVPQAGFKNLRMYHRAKQMRASAQLAIDE